MMVVLLRSARRLEMSATAFNSLGVHVALMDSVATPVESMKPDFFVVAKKLKKRHQFNLA